MFGPGSDESKHCFKHSESYIQKHRRQNINSVIVLLVTVGLILLLRYWEGQPIAIWIVVSVLCLTVFLPFKFRKVNQDEIGLRAFSVSIDANNLEIRSFAWRYSVSNSEIRRAVINGKLFEPTSITLIFSDTTRWNFIGLNEMEIFKKWVINQVGQENVRHRRFMFIV